jgi:hypothetical protein
VKIYDAGKGKSIKIFDDLFDYKYRTDVYKFAENSLFRIGWADGPVCENLIHRFLHSEYSNEDLQRLGFLEALKNTPVWNEISNLKLVKTILNLSVPSDCNFYHCHPEQKIVLYYVNLEWADGYHGETLFYDDTLKNIVLATPYTPGRVTVFDGAIPHAIRPQSYLSPYFRYTLALVYDKC